MRSILALCLFTSVAGCAAPASAPSAPRASPGYAAAHAPTPSQEPYPIERYEEGAWNPGQALLQGYFGVSSYDHVSVEGGEIDGDEGELDQLPLMGGGGQWKVGGRRIDWGIEGLFSFAGRANAEAFAVGGGGAVVAVDVDLLLFELYGGPFASVFLGDKVRVYGAAGPMLEWADYEQETDGLPDDGSGFGGGWYARTGFEFVLPSWTLIGLGVRWSDATVDLGGSLGDLEIDGLQYMITCSRGI